MERSCEGCGKPFVAKRKTARYCGPTCRSRASLARSRAARSGTVVQLTAPAPAEGEQGAEVQLPIRAAVEAALTKANKLDTPAGQTALHLAARLDRSGGESASAVASLSREMDRLLSELMADVPKEPDGLDRAQGKVLEMPRRQRRA